MNSAVRNNAARLGNASRVTNAASKLANNSRKTGTLANRLKNTAKNTQRVVTSRVKSANAFEVIVGIVIIIVLLFALYYLISYLVSRRESDAVVILKAPVNAYDGRLKNKKTKVPKSVNGLVFTYSYWMYIGNWNYRFGELKNIFVKGNEENSAPAMYLYPRTNSIRAAIATYSEDGMEYCDVKNVPLQKWVHVGYVLNNRTVDIYVNGKLERSCVLKGVPRLNNGPVRLAASGGSSQSGFYGKLSKFIYYPRALMPDELYKIYTEGPDASTGYRIRFFQDGKLFTTKPKSELDEPNEEE